jgi:predicted anti-sigma-YlaC factor YlaD
MNPHVTEWLSAYSDGELQASRRQQVEAHLAACPACRSALQEQDRLGALLQEWNVPAGLSQAALTNQVKLRLPRRQAAPSPWQAALKTAWQWAPLALAGVWLFGQALVLAGNLLFLSGFQAAGLALHNLANPFGWWTALINYAGETLLTQSGSTNLSNFLQAFTWSVAASVGISLGVAALFWSWIAIWWAYRKHLAQEIG